MTIPEIKLASRLLFDVYGTPRFHELSPEDQALLKSVLTSLRDQLVVESVKEEMKRAAVKELSRNYSLDPNKTSDINALLEVCRSWRLTKEEIEELTR